MNVDIWTIDDLVALKPTLTHDQWRYLAGCEVRLPATISVPEPHLAKDCILARQAQERWQIAPYRIGIDLDPEGKKVPLNERAVISIGSLKVNTPAKKSMEDWKKRWRIKH